MFSAIIIDDEKKVVESISILIHEYCKSIKIIGKAYSIASAEKLISSENPDLVFLDVEMPHGTGFDILELFPNRNFDVIFITAFSQYAIKAFKFCAIDYLLKPVNKNELIIAVEKVIQRRTEKINYNHNYNNLISSLKQTTPEKLAISSNDGIEFININEIIFIEASNRYSIFKLHGNQKKMVSKNLGEYEKLFENSNFKRVHKSFIVNTNFIKKICRENGSNLLMDDGSIIPLSRSKKEELLEIFRF